MTTTWQKVVRDFWLERTRTVLVVLAIAMGIAGFATVLSAYAILIRELDKGYLETNPASAVLRTDSINEVLLNTIRSNRDVSEAEASRVVSGRIRVGPVEWRSLTLFVVKDYGNIRVSKLQPQQGAWPPATGEILIERDAFQVAQTQIGKTVSVKTTNGKERTLLVGGSVHDVGQAQARMENIAYGYINLDTLTYLGEEPYLDRLNILVNENRLDEDHIRQVVANLKNTIEALGHQVRRIDVPTPGKHPHSDLISVLLLAMSSFGLFVLVLSGILVINLLTALMASQVRQIGMMKAIGGSRWQIARIYLGQALMLGIVAMVIALPAGIWGGRVLCRYLAGFLNFDIKSFAVPLWVFLLIGIVGLVVPLLAAAYPVWKGSGISVLQALSSFGVSQDTFGTTVFDRIIARMGGRFRPLLLAIRNSFRRRTRLALTLLTMAVSGLFFMSALNVRASMINTLDQLFASKKFDLTLVFGSAYPFQKIERAIINTPGVVRAEGWFTTEAALLHTGNESTSNTPNGDGSHAAEPNASRRDRFTVIALPPETTLLKLDLVEGRGLLQSDTDALVVNNALAERRPELRVGNTVVLSIGPADTTWRVVGIAREAFTPPIAYIPQAFIEQRHSGMTNSARLVLDKKDSASINTLKDSLERNLEEGGVRALKSMSNGETRVGFDEHMLMIYVFLIVMSGIIGLVGCLGLMTTMSLNVLERRREMGLLRAIGASPPVVWIIVIAEGLVIGVFSWALAALAAWPFSKIAGEAIVGVVLNSGLDFFFEPRGLVIWLAISVVVSVVGSFLPAWHASRLTVREALAYE